MKERSISGTLGRRAAVLMLCLWLLVSAVLTFLLAGDLLRQGAAVGEEAVSVALAEVQTAWEEGRVSGSAEALPRLSVPSFTPDLGFPLLRARETVFFPGGMTLDGEGAIAAVEGLDIGNLASVSKDGAGTIPVGIGLSVRENRLCVLPGPDYSITVSSDSFRGELTFFLTFQKDPARRGSFPLSAGSAYTEEEKGVYEAGKPVRPGTYEPGTRVDGGAIFAPGAENYGLTSPALLDAIESGEVRFDSRRLLHASLLRGCWLRDVSGTGRAFVLAALGWSPLMEAAIALTWVYLLLFVLFQLAGAALWLGLRGSLVRPLRALDAALREAPSAVTELEYDIRTPYGELRGLLAGFLLRRQMLSAQTFALLAGQKGGSAGEAELLPVLRRCEEKQLPILRDRGLRLSHDLKSDGKVPATAAALEDILLAFFRELVPYGELNGPLALRTLEKPGFLMLEGEVQAKRLSPEGFQLLWDGIYRGPKDMDAPGAKLRKALNALPGAFAALRKTKAGLILSLGLPLAGEATAADGEGWMEGIPRAYPEEQAPPLTEAAAKAARKRKLLGVLSLVVLLLLLALGVFLTVRTRRTLYLR